MDPAPSGAERMGRLRCQSGAVEEAIKGKGSSNRDLRYRRNGCQLRSEVKHSLKAFHARTTFDRLAPCSLQNEASSATCVYFSPVRFIL